MIIRQIKQIFLLIICWLCTLTALAQQNPTAVYHSKKVYFAKAHPKNGSSEPYKELDNGYGMYLFAIYTDHIIVHGNETIDMKIVSQKEHKGETKYNLTDAKGRHFELYINAEDKIKSSTTINYIAFDNNYVPVATYMMVCEKH